MGTIDKRSLARPLLITTAIIGVYLVSGWYTVELEERRWLESRHAEMEVELRNQASEIERHLNRALVAAESMESYIRHHEGMIEDFDTHSADLIRNVGIISALELAPGGVVTHLFPLAGYQDLLGRRIAEQGPGAFEARQAMVTRESTLSNLFVLADGTRAIVGRAPVYIAAQGAPPATDDHAAVAGGEQFWGFASVIIKIDDLQQETQLYRLRERGYRYQLTGSTEGEAPVQIAGSAISLESEQVVETMIRVARGGILLRLKPVVPWLQSPMYVLHIGVYASLGMLLAVFLSSILWLPVRLRAQIARTNHDLLVAKGRYQAVFDSVREVIFQIDGEHRWQLLNPAWKEITGFEVTESLGQPAATYLNAEDVGRFQMLLDESLAGRQVGAAELRLRGRDGEERWIELSLRGHSLGDGVSGSLRDITERKRSDQLIRYQANYDTLTGLPNRKLFRDRFTQAIEFGQRNSTRLALMFIDLDRFKSINDTFGHAVGDKLLQEVARRLRSCVRKVDTVGRFGGDEFIILLAEIGDAIDVEIVSRKVLEEISRPFQLDSSEEGITCSIGITICPEDGDDIATLMNNADNVMYLAKESGRNTFKFFTEEMNKELKERRRKEEALRHAIDNHDLALYFQPIYRVKDHQPVAIEALLRWNSEEFADMPIRDIISLAENTRMIHVLGAWVLREACLSYGRMREAGLSIEYVNINFSPRQFRGGGFEQIEELLDEGGIEPHQLAIDITEELVAIDQAVIWDALARLKQRGVLIILDNFGSGLSSLAHLSQLSPGAIKISGDYLAGTVPEANAAAMIGSIIAMAHSIGVDVISEGVGSARQSEMMSTLGCNFEQGNHLCEPLPVEALIERLKAT